MSKPRAKNLVQELWGHFLDVGPSILFLFVFECAVNHISPSSASPPSRQNTQTQELIRGLRSNILTLLPPTYLYIPTCIHAYIHICVPIYISASIHTYKLVCKCDTPALHNTRQASHVPLCMGGVQPRLKTRKSVQGGQVVPPSFIPLLPSAPCFAKDGV